MCNIMIPLNPLQRENGRNRDAQRWSHKALAIQPIGRKSKHGVETCRERRVPSAFSKPSEVDASNGFLMSRHVHDSGTQVEARSGGCIARCLVSRRATKCRHLHVASNQLYLAKHTPDDTSIKANHIESCGAPFCLPMRMLAAPHAFARCCLLRSCRQLLNLSLDYFTT